MRINTKCSSATHILVMIAMLPDTYKITSEFLASSLGNNPVEVRKLLSSLKKAGIIQVSRGTGGTSLTKEPKNITLLDIYTAVDPKSLDQLIGIHAHPSQDCPFGKNIGNLLAAPYAEIGSVVRQKMASITLAQLCDRLQDIEPSILKNN